jgi:hypothetical protein
MLLKEHTVKITSEKQLKEFQQKYHAEIELTINTPDSFAMRSGQPLLGAWLGSRATIEMPFEDFERLYSDSCLFNTFHTEASNLKIDPESIAVIKFPKDMPMHDVVEIYNRIRASNICYNLLIIPSDIDLISMSVEQLKAIRKSIDDMITWSDYDHVVEQAKTT